jgi:hypothetical protein
MWPTLIELGIPLIVLLVVWVVWPKGDPPENSDE